MSLEKPDRWYKNKSRLIITSVAILCVGFIMLVILGYWFDWDWTGLNAFIGPNVRQYQPTRTLWDWMQLLIIPVVLAGTAFMFNFATSKNESAMEQKRDETEQEIAKDNQREDLLQGYLDRMSELLLDKSLGETQQSAEVRNIARARTLTVLSRLDKVRKRSLITFLYESGLIGAVGVDGIIDLSQANLRKVDLSRVNLPGAKLGKADLTGAKLVEARLSAADLEGAELTGASLIGAKLSETNLTDVNLSKANLAGANLIEARLHRARLTDANLHAANLAGAKLNEADLRNTDLSMANLRRTNLHSANLAGAKLNEADLGDADLSMANLRRADLQGAILVDANLDKTDYEGASYTEEQIEGAKHSNIV